ncbi:SET and MYND domain-containing protein 4-like [Microplitis mediator]|uniref:SET and MYND domain-containing protein 4-like n=1 Tax=Microplitis mediator TaxID=375433 RepID=UPI0025579DD0|nr:SET and MYND domain-containing protein 4-like [Microplitis mediator]
MHKLTELLEKFNTLKIHSLASKHFQGAKTDEDFVKKALKMHLDMQDQLPDLLPAVEILKCADKAKWYLNEGKRISSLSFVESVEAFNYAMANGSPGSELLAHAFANRSAVLTTNGRYEESLKDIRRALEENYPDHLRATLYVRRAKNLLALNPVTNVDEIIVEAKHWASKMSEKEKTKLLNNIDKLKTKKFKKPVKELNNQVFMPATPNDNPRFKNTSGAITVNYSDKFGRHIVATRDIKAGEALCVKKVYALILLEEYQFKRCWNCSKHCWSSVPCNKCSHVIYCSEECRDISWNEYHDIECAILNAILYTTQFYEEISLMSLRILIKALKEYGTVEALYEDVQKMNSMEDPIMQTLSDNTYDDTKFASVYALNRKPMDLRFQVQTGLKALQYMYAMALTTDVFGKKMKSMTELANNKWVVFIGKLLFHQTVLSSSNMFAIAANSDNLEEDLPQCGGVLIPLESLYNHSCDPDIQRFDCRDLTTFISIHPIKKGQQIFLNYGPDFQDKPTSERRAKLENVRSYWCDCIACVNDWNPGHDFPSACMQNIIPKRVAFRVSTVLVECCDEYTKILSSDSAQDLSPQRLKNLMSNLFALLNTLGKYDVYPCEEMTAAKAVLLGTFKLMIGYQT